MTLRDRGSEVAGGIALLVTGIGVVILIIMFLCWLWERYVVEPKREGERIEKENEERAQQRVEYLKLLDVQDVEENAAFRELATMAHKEGLLSEHQPDRRVAFLRNLPSAKGTGSDHIEWEGNSYASVVWPGHAAPPVVVKVSYGDGC